MAVAGPPTPGWRIVSLWDSTGAFEAFHACRLTPGLQEQGRPARHRVLADRERDRLPVATVSGWCVSPVRRDRGTARHEHFSEFRLVTSFDAEVANAVAAVTTPATPLDPTFVTAVCREVRADWVAVTWGARSAVACCLTVARSVFTLSSAVCTPEVPELAIPVTAVATPWTELVSESRAAHNCPLEPPDAEVDVPRARRTCGGRRRHRGGRRGRRVVTAASVGHDRDHDDGQEQRGFRVRLHRFLPRRGQIIKPSSSGSAIVQRG